MSAKDTMTNRVAYGRSLLFVPGHRPERFEKAANSGADVLVLDLEDSVPALEKPAARAAIAREWPRLQSSAVAVVVRMNSVESEEGRRDLALLEQLESLPAVMVPKAESAQALARVHQQLQGVALVPIIESAAGYAALPTLAGAPGVTRLAIGHIDFMADTGFECDSEQTELAPLRFAVAMATRLNRLASAVDGVTVEIGDEERLRKDVHRALGFGFGGKLCIHPRQIDVVHQAMLPAEAQLEWARKVLAASVAAGGAAVQVDGRMVDLPVVLQAHRTLARAAARAPA
jgi:citrate lyase subunit beta / citryl-CoA lyase